LKGLFLIVATAGLKDAIERGVFCNNSRNDFISPRR